MSDFTRLRRPLAALVLPLLALALSACSKDEKKLDDVRPVRAIVQHVHGQEHREERKPEICQNEDDRARRCDHGGIEQHRTDREKQSFGDQAGIGITMVTACLQVTMCGAAQVIGQRG